MQAPAETNGPPKTRVLDVGISRTSYEDTCRWIAVWADSGTPAYICVCNVHSVMEAHNDPEVAQALNGASISTPDGVPLVWALRAQGTRDQQRVYGPDLVLAFAEFAAKRQHLASYFYGAGPGVANELASTLTARYPGFEVVGSESPPFRDLTPAEDEEAVRRINESGAKVLWVGLGAPKQELWMAAHADRIRPVMVGVGAAFDFLTGRTAQAPRWMMDAGLEWAFRFATEPRRLWRRYVYNNPHFLWHMAGQLASPGEGEWPPTPPAGRHPTDG